MHTTTKTVDLEIPGTENGGILWWTKNSLNIFLVGGKYEMRGDLAHDFYSYSILRTIVLVPPTPLSPELLRSLVSTMAAAGSSALPSPVSG